MINALSIDLEYWWNIELLKDKIPEEKADLIVESVDPLLDLLDQYNVHATFFVLGMVAEKYPDIIEEIHKQGHEIGCHGYSHKTLYDLGETGFEEDIKKALVFLRKYRPIGYRAPSFSLNNDTIWSLQILERYGFLYDSSIFPIKTMLYGVPDAPLHIYKPSKDDITQSNPLGQITEFPLTALKIGKNIPIAGGFYLRALPLWLSKWGIHHTNKEKRPAVVYLHPWETCTQTPKIKMPLPEKIITYYGLGFTLKKLEGLLKEFRFRPMREVLYDV